MKGEVTDLVDTLVRFRNSDGEVIFRERREVPQLFQEINGCQVYKIEHFDSCGYHTVDVTLVEPWKLRRRVNNLG